MNINLLEVLPPAIIDETLQKKLYNNLEKLYNVSYEIRLTILDLLKVKKLALLLGNVYAFGLGQYGQLGDDDTLFHKTGIPIEINSENNEGWGNNEKITSVSAGSTHTFVLADRIPLAVYDRS